ncbi:hypothetical protein D3C78_1891040 [compost metagenome]
MVGEAAAQRFSLVVRHHSCRRINDEAQHGIAVAVAEAGRTGTGGHVPSYGNTCL